ALVSLAGVPSAEPHFDTQPVTRVNGDAEYRYGVIASDLDGEVSITADTIPDWLVLTDDPGWTVSTFSGGQLGVGYSDGDRFTAQFKNMYGICVGPDGDFFIADTHNHRIRRVDAETGEVSTVAGSGQNTHADGVGTAASFFYPQGIDSDGDNLWVADAFTNTIRHIEVSTGTVTTVAGTPGVMGLLDGEPGDAQFNRPKGVTVDPDLNVYVSDTDNNVIRRIDSSSGIVTTIAGSTEGVAGYVDAIGDAARFASPRGLEWAPDGEDGPGVLLVADKDNSAIRRVDLSDFSVSTVAGGSEPGSQDGNALDATFFDVFDVTRAPNGDLFVADSGNHRIRRISEGVVTTLAGDGTPGYAEGLDDRARFQFPRSIAVAWEDDQATTGPLYIADRSNGAIRLIRPTTARLEGTASEEMLGNNYSVILTAHRDDQSAQQSFNISVDGLNHRPTISGEPATFIFEGQAFDLTPVASDEDGDSLHFSINTIPRWAFFDPSTGRLHGTPGYDDAGLILLLAITADDQQGYDNSTITLQPFNLMVADAEPPAEDTSGAADMGLDRSDMASADIGLEDASERDAGVPSGDVLFDESNGPDVAADDVAAGDGSGGDGQQ
ncbi:MAG: hypothetical protein KC561_15685, partial [Myxococcales bacterium]|nr:hypothetical protein [Myxococcales bacterium]